MSGEQASLKYGYGECGTQTLVALKETAEKWIQAIQVFSPLYSDKMAVAQEKYRAICWALRERN